MNFQKRLITRGNYMECKKSSFLKHRTNDNKKKKETKRPNCPQIQKHLKPATLLNM